MDNLFLYVLYDCGKLNYNKRTEKKLFFSEIEGEQFFGVFGIEIA
jgi:hypothetical protein